MAGFDEASLGQVHNFWGRGTKFVAELKDLVQ